MITLMFIVAMLAVFGKMIGLAVKATWGITKVLFTIIFLPVILIVLAIGGLMSIAFPLLIVVGIGMLIASAIKAV